MYSREQILDFLAKNKKYLQQEFHITKIGLFGSFSRNEQSDKSDIDIVLEFEEDTPNLFEIKQALRNYFKDKLNVKADICREKYIKPIFRERILNEAIYVE